MELPVLLQIFLGLLIGLGWYFFIHKKAAKPKVKNSVNSSSKGLYSLDPRLKSIDEELARLNKKAAKAIENDKSFQEFYLEMTKKELLKKSKKRLINIANKELNIKLDLSMKKKEMVEMIYLIYHMNRGGADYWSMKLFS